MEEGREWVGGYDCRFVEQPPDDLLCLICTFVARDPQQLTCCGRVFCEKCIVRHRASTPKCPNCSRMISNFPDSRSDRQIKALRVHCNNYGLGCPWTGELRHLSAHEKWCTFARVECPNKCSEVVLRMTLKEHAESKCPRRRFKCPHCHQYGTYRAIMSVHIEECPEITVPCPNGCIVSIIRRELESHLMSCPKEEIACPFEDVGCNNWMLREMIPQHERENQDKHLHLAMQTISKLKRSVNHLKMHQNLTRPVGVYKLTNFQESKAKQKDWTSPPFYSHPRGYKLCLNVEVNGYETGKGSHISAFVYVMKGKNDEQLPWPCRAHVTIELLNQLQDEGHHRHSVDLENENAARVKEGETTGNGYGPHKFISHDELQYDVKGNTQYLKDDSLFFRVRVSCDSIYRPWLEEFH